MKDQYFSKEGLEKLKKELHERMEVTRPQIAQRIKEAKEQGDLSENAEFDAAKEAQAINEGRIEEIRNILENAVIVDHAKSSGVVSVGSTIKAESDGKNKEYTIVGVSESDPAKGFVSNESPLGKAFLGHKKGDDVEVRTPKGISKYKIVDVK